MKRSNLKDLVKWRSSAAKPALLAGMGLVGFVSCSIDDRSVFVSARDQTFGSCGGVSDDDGGAGGDGKVVDPSITTGWLGKGSSGGRGSAGAAGAGALDLPSAGETSGFAAEGTEGGAGGTVNAGGGDNGMPVCPSDFTLGRTIQGLNGKHFQRPLGVTDQGDILYEDDAEECGALEFGRLLFARRRGEQYDIYDLTGRAALSDTVPTLSTLWPQGRALLLTRKDQHGFVLAEFADGNVGEPTAGPFAELNQALAAVSVRYPVISGDGLTFVFWQNGHFVSRRGDTNEPFPPATQLKGDIESFWQVTALSFDGLTAFVLKDWNIYPFDRKYVQDDFALMDARRLNASNFVLSPSCRYGAAAYLSGGCDNGDIVEVNAL